MVLSWGERCAMIGAVVYLFTSGAAFALLGPPPPRDAPADTLRRWLDRPGRFRANLALNLVNTALLLGFACALHSYVVKAHLGGAAVALSFAGGIAGSAALFVALALAAAAHFHAEAKGGDDSLRALWLTASSAFAVSAAPLAALPAGGLWIFGPSSALGAAGVAVAALQLASIAAFLWNRARPLPPIAYVSFFLWVAAVGARFVF
jgi:hypothetical protein